jgi:hypothetical protein
MGVMSSTIHTPGILGARLSVLALLAVALPGQLYGSRNAEAKEGGLACADAPYRPRFEAHGVRLDGSPPGSGGVTLKTARFGCVGELQPLAEVTPVSAGRRVQYIRPELTEWYVRGPSGLEQGFTVRQAPACALGGNHDLALEIAVEGAEVMPTVDGDAVGLRTYQGGRQFQMTDLVAFDAAGNRLDARMEGSGAAATLRVRVAGARFPVVIDPWIQEKRFKADVSSDDREVNFGHSVSISGETIVAGMFHEFPEERDYPDATYVYVRGNAAWTLQETLVPSQGDDSIAGAHVAVSGDTAVIQSYEGTLVYARSGTVWEEQQRLLTGGSESLAVSGDTVLVGTFLDDDGTDDATGAVYVFVRSGVTWSLQQKLTPADGGPDDLFGASVSIWGDTALVGAWGGWEHPGAAYVFVREGTTWSEQQKLEAPHGTADDMFGSEVSVHGDLAVVGAEGGHAAYAFVRSDGTWSEAEPLVPEGGTPDEFFGMSVSVSGDNALIGSMGDASLSTSGAAYVFSHSSGEWTQQHRLVPDEPGFGFGWSVSLSGNTAVVGDYEDIDGDSAVYVFRCGAETAEACSTAADCMNQGCSDGVCCDSACDGACETCSIRLGATEAGRCTTLAAGSASAPPCGSRCDGLSPECPTCGSDADCIAGYYCDAGSSYCHLIEAEGRPCTADRGCQSGFCVDGVCCISACVQSCYACSQQETGQPDGTCQPVTAGEDPDNECARSEASTCGQDGACDGAGACRLWPAGTGCGAPFCANAATLHDSDTCDGRGACREGVETACRSGTLCDAARCTRQCTSGADCETSEYCGDGSCAPLSAEGSACSSGAACRSGVCHDGKCVDRECGDLARDCSPYACRAGECLDECRSDGDCVRGAECVRGRCGFRAGACAYTANASRHTRFGLSALVLLAASTVRRAMRNARSRYVPSARTR